MTRVRIDLAYDGTGFRGFARQADQRTVQGVLEDALSSYFATDVTLTVAGRTDAGVHALHQAVHFDVDTQVITDRLHRSLHNLCGSEIAIWSVQQVTDEFDARRSAVGRRYRYRLHDGRTMDPLMRFVTWHIGLPRLDDVKMHTGGQHLIGEHDFSSFCRRSGDQHLTRRIDVLTVTRDGDLLDVVVEGRAFCHQMVRSIVGSLVAVGRGKWKPDTVRDVLLARDRTKIGEVAPARGLTLIGVDY